MNKLIPYGESDFAFIIKNGYLYVDKTRFIRTIENAVNVIVFFRPRRFGKSLFISMLNYYYDYKHKENFNELFGNTYIGANPTSLRNKFSVIKFDFSGIDTMDVEGVKAGFLHKVKEAIKSFIKDNSINEADPIDFEDKTSTPSTIMNEFLTRIAKYLENPLYILIDEYDHFANNMLGLRTLDFKAMVSAGGFVRTFFEVIKEGKGADIIRSIFIAGVCPITLDSLTSGFNIAMNISRLKPFNEMVGFTEEEVKWLIDTALDEFDIDKDAILHEMASLYNGYSFNGTGDNKVFNSDMVLNYLKSYQFAGEPPQELLDSNVLNDYSKLQGLMSLNLGESNNANFTQIEEAKELRTESFISIIQGEPQPVVFTQVYELIKFSHYDFLTLLFYMGYLTIDSVEGRKTNLVLPNEAMRIIFCDYFSGMYLSPSLGMDNRAYHEAMMQMSEYGSNEKFVKCLSDIMGLSSNRIYKNFSEKHFQFLGYVIARDYSGYITTMEEDVGYGYVDLAFLPAKLPVKYYCFQELKYIKGWELDPKPEELKDVDLESYRLGLIKKKWDEGVAQLRKYSQNPKFSDLQAQGRLKSWVVIFSTHRCLVNQEIDVHAADLQMELREFDWWFHPRNGSCKDSKTATACPPSLAEAAVALANAGVSQSGIAGNLGISVALLKRILVEANWNDDICAKHAEEVVKLIKQGVSQIEAARKLGIVEDVVVKILKSEKLPYLPAGSCSSDLLSSVLKLSNQGMSQKDIAVKLGESPGKIARILKTHRFYADSSH
jgi:DNA-binding CsgD family transcriptional regulator